MIIHYATELDYTTLQPLTDDLGEIGNGGRYGYICQNSMAVDPATRGVIGLTSQRLHVRENALSGETKI